MIPLMKSTFYHEKETKDKLCEFIRTTERLSMGEKCKEFEKQFALYQGRQYAVLVNSGSSANLALIQALINEGKLKRGDPIGFSALTWATNVAPLVQLGLHPIPVDVSLKTLNVSSENLLKVIKSTPLKALFVTNLLGFCGDLDIIAEICKKEGIILVEDNCESFGSKYRGKMLGNFGLASTFSLFVGHHLSTVEGGVICTDDKDFYEMLMMVRAHGWSRDVNPEKRKNLMEKHGVSEFFDKYTFYVPGYNIRPTEITGFIGLEQLRYADEIVKKRESNFKRFSAVASQNQEISIVDASHMDTVSNFAYPITFYDSALFESYKAQFSGSVEIRPIVGGSMIEQPFFKDYAAQENITYAPCTNAMIAHKRGFYFPNNPDLSEEDLQILTSLLTKKKQDSGVETYVSRTAPARLKTAFITGVTGQDGSYLAESLLEKGYEVHGLVRRASAFNRHRLEGIYKSPENRHKNFFLHYGDVTDGSGLAQVLAATRPDEIYNLAAQSHVKISFETSEYTASTDALGALRLLEAMRILGLHKTTKFYHASTSELFGRAQEVPQKETTPFYPRSPYGVAKLYSHWIVKNYREAYNIFACNGILFNHESPRRGENFVSKKVTRGVAEIKFGIRDKISLGNLNAMRDWGYAKDYVEAMWLMLQRDKPEDYVIATGETHSVRDFVEAAFDCVGIQIKWVGNGIDEKGIDIETGQVVIEIDPEYFRPSEVDFLLGDASKAREELKWNPTVRFRELVRIMMAADIEDLIVAHNLEKSQIGAQEKGSYFLTSNSITKSTAGKI